MFIFNRAALLQQTKRGSVAGIDTDTRDNITRYNIPFSERRFIRLNERAAGFRQAIHARQTPSSTRSPAMPPGGPLRGT